MSKYQLLTTDNELIFESDNIVTFESYVRNQIIHDIEFKLSNEYYPLGIVKAFKNDIKLLSDENVKAETIMMLANDWGYII